MNRARGEVGSPTPAAERALKELQRLVRRPPSTAERSALTMKLPADLASDETQTLCFVRDEVDAADEATTALIGDVRFEHLDRAEDKVPRFMAECWADRSTGGRLDALHQDRARVTASCMCSLPDGVGLSLARVIRR